MSGKQAGVQPLQVKPAAVGGLLQRKCACGQHTIAGGECEECRKKRETGMLQRAPLHPSSSSPHPSEVPPIVHEVLRSPGQPLDAATRAFMEPRFGHDFSRVRVHADSKRVQPAQIRAKLQTNQPGDIYEQEADRVADYVVRGSLGRWPGIYSALVGSTGSLLGKLQRNPADDVEHEILNVVEEEDMGTEVETEHEEKEELLGDTEEIPGEEGPLNLEDDESAGVAMPKRDETKPADTITHVPGGEGRPLERAPLNFMENRFGYRFSNVRIHTDTGAMESAYRLGAKAYTVGSHIYFGKGYYDPLTTTGRWLLAHELTHVIQQGNGNLRGIIQRQERSRSRPPRQRRRPRPEQRILVDLRAQTALAMVGEHVVRRLPISSGMPGHETHTGRFRITERDIDHRSSTYGHCVSDGGTRRQVGGGSRACRRGERYEGTPMTYFQRFNGPEGFHVGPLPGRPASHGCIRLRRADARWLWDWSSSGTQVDIVPSRPRQRRR